MSISRRNLLGLAAASPLATLPKLSSTLPVSAVKVPTQKHPKTDLRGRGEPLRAERAALKYIGMPIGGIACGTVYLSGEGRLWVWDVLNDNRGGVNPKTVQYGGKEWGATSGSAYISPTEYQPAFEDDIWIEVEDGSRTTLDASGFGKIVFEGRYPMGVVEFTDAAAPVEILLKAHPVWIPLETDDSSLPATCMRYLVKNTSHKPITIKLNMSTGAPVAGKDGDAKIATMHGGAGFGTRANAADGAPNSGSYCIAVRGAVDVMAEATFANKKAVITGGTTLNPGESQEIQFVVSWWYPNVKMGIADDATRRHYAKRFDSAQAVTQYIFDNWDKLVGATEKWVETWYDSTLPYWFLDRTMATVGTLATSTCTRFGSGRFYGWEGVGCCAGTCTHVWHYAQAVAALFPDLERDTRERVDFGLALKPDGQIEFRAEFDLGEAVDGQAGTILRALREHRMAPDASFLSRVWPKVKLATEFLMKKDLAGDGLIAGAQENTLDAAWFGKIPWISSLAAASYRAAAIMATEVGDADFAKTCIAEADKAGATIARELFNGEYFFQIPDPNHPKALGANTGCDIDQVLGEAWARLLHLDRVLDRNKTLSALRSLWKYNFVPDAGAFRRDHQEGRWYAMDGDAGMVMVTEPKHDKSAFGDVANWTFGYFNECMSGFEHAVAAHMIAEGMVDEGLTVIKAIHDRYAPEKRNPYNEVECSDHYSRAMASFGAFRNACGYQFDGPNRTIGFAPAWDQNHFRAPFVASQGWGVYEQTVGSHKMAATVELRHGSLSVKKLRLQVLDGEAIKSVKVDGKDATFNQAGPNLEIDLDKVLVAGQKVSALIAF